MLQSSRQEKREKFQKDDTSQRKTLQRFASLCISFKVILTTSLEIRREAFILPLIRV
jgi:hypothetical protein